MDVASSSIIAKNAIRIFIEDAEPKGEEFTETEVIEVASIIEEEQEEKGAEKN